MKLFLHNKYGFIFPFLFYILITLSSCKKFVDIPPPIDEITTSQVFSNDNTATAAMIGLYSNMMSTNLFFASGALTIYPALSADEITNTNNVSDITDFTNNSLSPANSVLQNQIWRFGYNYIYQANAIMEGVSSSPTVSLPVKQELTGEAKFVRAFCYFYLVNLFGDIPLETTTDYRINAAMARTSSDKIYQQLISDLKDADSLLPVNYINNEKTRPNKWAAAALLARVYLYQQKWQEAEDAANQVINSQQYNLDNDLNAVFLANSTEAIWQLQPVMTYPTSNTLEGYAFIPGNGQVPGYLLTQFLLNAFEPGDARKNYWIDSTVINGQTFYYPFKYKIKTGNGTTEYSMVLRLAETYLIRAEARAQQNNITGAQDDLNTIRNRAGLLNTTASDQTTLLAAIEQERQVELFCEWGQRWLDLKRSNIDDELGAEKSGWKTTDALYPIPLTEIKTNPALVQNPGY